LLAVVASLPDRLWEDADAHGDAPCPTRSHERPPTRSPVHAGRPADVGVGPTAAGCGSPASSVGEPRPNRPGTDPADLSADLPGGRP
jgi:hypothetical protein